MEERIEIRDHRQPGWFWLNREVITKYAKEIGVYGLAIYSLLAMHANNETQRAWPSLPYMGALLGISQPTLLKYLRKLEQAGLISIDRQNGKHNTYTLLKISASTPKRDLEVKEGPLKEIKNPLKEIKGCSKPPLDELDLLTRLNNNTHTCVSKNFVSKMEARYGKQKVEEVLEELENQKAVRNPEAWVKAALRGEWSFSPLQGKNEERLRRDMKFCLRGKEATGEKCFVERGILKAFDYCCVCPRLQKKTGGRGPVQRARAARREI